MWQRIKSIVDERVIRPLRDSHAPIDELALGSAVGVFWAVTPLVGVQMTLATITWFLFKPIGLRFNLPVAMAWVWISNPVTMPLMYYTFYLSGIVVYEVGGIHRTVLSFDAVKQVINDANAMPVMEGVMHWTTFMLESMGGPMMIGCLVFCIPLAVVSYPLTIRMVNDYRRRKALGLGLSLEDWEARYVYKTVPVDAPLVESNIVNEFIEMQTPSRPKTRKKSASGRRKKSAGKNGGSAKSGEGKKGSRNASKKTANKSRTAKKKSGRKPAKAAFKTRPATA